MKETGKIGVKIQGAYQRKIKVGQRGEYIA